MAIIAVGGAWSAHLEAACYPAGNEIKKSQLVSRAVHEIFLIVFGFSSYGVDLI